VKRIAWGVGGSKSRIFDRLVSVYPLSALSSGFDRPGSGASACPGTASACPAAASACPGTASACPAAAPDAPATLDPWRLPLLGDERRGVRLPPLPPGACFSDVYEVRPLLK
jgi:hypothetical protein